MGTNAPSSVLPTLQNSPKITNPLVSSTVPPATSAESTAALPERPSEPKISKAAAKREAKKAANKAIKQEAKKGAPSKSSSKQAPFTKAQDVSAPTEESDSMFKVGFLADVYKERPTGSEGINGIITRCGSTHQSKR